MIRFFKGRMRCSCCRITWIGVWSTAAPTLICHECGARDVVPEGPQIPAFKGYPTIAAMWWVIEEMQVRKGRS